MPVLFADTETFWSTDFSLSKMSTEAYVRSKEFQCHGWAVGIDREPVEFLTEDEAIRFFYGLDWNNILFVAHNAMFDASVIAHRYGLVANLYCDTMGLANVFVRPHTGRSSLDTCAAFMHLPLKSSIIKQLKGMRTQDIIATPGMWDAMADYGIQDVENMKEVFFTYYPKLNRTERLKLSWATKNYVQPRLRLDEQVIFNSLINAEVKREKALAAAGIDEKTARSGPKFAVHLKSMGIEVEMKEGKVMEIPALSKDDNFMLQALKGDNTLLKTAVLARLAAMSNIELTRANRLKEMCEAADGMMLTPTNYAAAHTGRNGGYDGVNLLNFPRDSPLRKAIRPPEGYVIADGDASQIEMRIMAWLAQQEDLLDMF